MKIEFKEGVNEFANGELTWHRDKQPFDVDNRVGNWMLKTGYFQEVVAKEPEAPKRKKSDKESN